MQLRPHKLSKKIIKWKKPGCLAIFEKHVGPETGKLNFFWNDENIQEITVPSEKKKLLM